MAARSPKSNGFLQLFRFASRTERLIQLMGALAALSAGATLPVMTILLGSTTELFLHTSSSTSSPLPSSSVRHGLDVSTHRDINKRALYLVYVALFALVTNSLFTFCWVHTGLRITSRTRGVFLERLLARKAAFHDGMAPGKVTEQLTKSFDAIQDGISEKVGLAVYSLSTFVTAFAVALIKDWRLALVVGGSVAPAMFVPTSLLARLHDQFAERALRFAGEASAVTEEMFAAIETTKSLGVPRGLLKKYDSAAGRTEADKVRAHFMHGCIVGTIYFVLFGAYALAFWEGARLFVAGEVDVSALITVLFVVIIGSFALGQGVRQIGVFSAAVAAGREIFAVIDDDSYNDISKDATPIPASFLPSIVFEQAYFAYPSRPESPLIRGLDLELQAGKMTAIVGHSGSGKSTLVNVLTRLYDLDDGRILLDGVDHRHFDVRSLRSLFAVVEQDTAIFSKSIFDNVVDGLGGHRRTYGDKKVKELVVDACKLANAHEFISRLPEGYDTLVGTKGASLSGGQRQRLAIARAIVSMPQILILDEATAALDTVSEEAVMTALRSIMHSRPITIILIAHRLSSIKKADNIVVIDQGRLLETGSHGELLLRRSAYCRLWRTGQLEDTTNDEQDSRSSRASIISNVSVDNRYSCLDECVGSIPCKSKVGRTAVIQHSRGPKKNSEQKPVFNIRREAFNLMLMNEGGTSRVLTGLFFSFVCGAAYPLQALIFAHLLLAFGDPDRSSLQRTANRYCLQFFCLAILKFIAHWGSISQLGICKERTIRKIRTGAFQAMLKKPLRWFERESNSTTALVSTLARCSDLEALHVATMALYLAVMVNLIGGSVTSFIFAWQLAFITTATIPLFLLSAYLRYRLLSAFFGNSKAEYLQATSLALEATSASRTVALLRLEDRIVQGYIKALNGADRRSFNTVVRLSLLFGLSQSATLFINALVIWSGARLISENRINTFGFFVAFISISFGAQDAGELFSYAPDISRARSLTQQLRGILTSDCGDRPLPQLPGPVLLQRVSRGQISFRLVSFSYPRRPSVKVLRRINLDIGAGQHIALVGASGSGKSTVMGLLERFHEPDSGQILVDGQDIRNYDTEHYRSSIGLVSQEPVLYDGSIAFNILLASDGNVKQWQLEAACQEANILGFIQSLPNGFETQVGSHGVMLSGGQKQRIVIARVLLQEAPIVLLDEATSALDFQSESLVQEALDRAMQGKTTITIAHRLSTIRGADCIYVFHRGRVVESGTHEELLRLRKRYWSMIMKS